VVRIARSVGVGLLALMSVIALGLASTLTPAIQLLATTALIMSGTFTPTPPPAFVDMAKNQFIVPTHPFDAFDQFVPVTTPEQAWPVTGLFDLPFGTSVRIGLADLQAAMAEHGNDDLVIFGHSQSSVISYLEKRRLAEQFPIGTPAPNIDFVTIGTLNLPNGGVMTRFWGLYLPFVDFYFNGPAPTDTQFDTDIITQRWDGFADFPIYPIVLPSVVNAVLGFFYVHEEYADVTLAPDPSKHFVGKDGDTEYYFFETENLPLFGPLRSLGVPESLIDIVEPFATFIVELGYRRDIPPWVPSPARLIPIHDPLKVIGDFGEALNETINNTLELLGVPPPPAPAPAPPPPAAIATTSERAAGSGAESMTLQETARVEVAESTSGHGTEEPAVVEEAVEKDEPTSSEPDETAGAEADEATTSSTTADEPASDPGSDSLRPNDDDADMTASNPSEDSPTSQSSSSQSSAGDATESDSAA
jgi:hypothetical protein